MTDTELKINAALHKFNKEIYRKDFSGELLIVQVENQYELRERMYGDKEFFGIRLVTEGNLEHIRSFISGMIWAYAGGLPDDSLQPELILYRDLLTNVVNVISNKIGG